MPAFEPPFDTSARNASARVLWPLGPLLRLVR
jgi:hypothetical protein